MIALLLACGHTPPPATTVQGVQIVAIQATPTNPTPDQRVRLDVWVADALGTGVDVLVWMCTPVLGTCVEAWLPGTDGLPLDVWTATGATDERFTVERAFPFYRTLTVGSIEALAGDSGVASELPVDLPADDDPSLVVWALACVPGRCPIVDDVRAGPIAGSDAWRDVVARLADPSRILEGVPPHQASVAVKQVPLFQETDPYLFYPSIAPVPDSPPQLTWDPPSPRATLSEDHGATFGYGIGADPAELDPALPDLLSWFDPDGDPVGFQAFTTAGSVSLSEPGVGQVLVSRRPDWRGRFGDLFVVADDGRGGTTVWSGRPEGDCSGPPTLEQRFYPSGRPVRDWDAFDVSADLLLTVRAHGIGFGAAQLQTRLYGPGDEPLAHASQFVDACGGLASTFALDWVYGVDRCALGGQVGRLETRVPASDGTDFVTSAQVVLTLDPALGCAE